MPKVQAPDANPLASRASEPEARVEGSSFHAKTPWLRPGGKSNGTDETRLRTGSQFAEMPSSQSLTQLDSVTRHVTRASHVFPQVRCMLVIPGPPYACHRRHFAFDRTRYSVVIPGPTRLHRVGTRNRFGDQDHRLTRAIPGARAAAACCVRACNLQTQSGAARKEQRAAPEWQRKGGAAKKQTAAPEGAAAWEPPFLTRKMLRDSYQHDACQARCINDFREQLPAS